MVHVGRGLNADLYLDDASVSRRHAIIVCSGGRCRILDDRSLNGTYVNGRQIEQAELRDGDLIALGRVEVVYREV
jgi:pSer/pThr/pTyr-binding forkhead associated (FHA) protein